MARIRRIYTSDATTLSRPFLPVRLQNGIASSPAEADRTNLVRAGCHAHCLHETVDQGSGYGFAVSDKPGPEGGGGDGGVLGLARHAKFLLVFEWGFDILEKGDGEGVAFVEIGEVHVEAGFSIVVG